MGYAGSRHRGPGDRAKAFSRAWVGSGLAMTARGGQVPCLHSEDREPEDQKHQEDHDKDVEQEARNVSASGRYAGEAEKTGDD